MKIDRNLRLITPLETQKNGVAHIYSMAIERVIFEQFYLELGKVYSQCFDSKNPEHFILSAPQLAYPALKSISMKMGTWEIKNAEGIVIGGVKSGMINEIVRLSTVMINGNNGWESLPLHTAIQRKLIDEDEEAEVLSSLIFFTVVCRVAPTEIANYLLQASASMRNWVLTLSDSMEFMSGLPTLTKADAIGAIQQESSVIY
jgi:hypothetical protein